MRKPIEKLAHELWLDEEIRGKGYFDDRDVRLYLETLSEVAEKYDETVERVMDALDVSKIARGELSIIPPLDWEF